MNISLRVEEKRYEFITHAKKKAITIVMPNEPSSTNRPAPPKADAVAGEIDRMTARRRRKPRRVTNRPNSAPWNAAVMIGFVVVLIWAVVVARRA